MHVHPRKVGLVGATILGGWHIIWSLLVLVGWAQAMVDFSMWAHMAHVAVIVGPFDASAAITVIVIATVAGYAVGYIVASIWNKVHRGK